MTIMLSICIATYNRSDLLEYCLSNVLAMNETGLNFEVIVSDNASTDNTSEICEKFKPQFKHFSYYRQTHNVGAGANITSAFRHASGKYTIYLADDDRIKSGNLCNLINLFEDNPELSVIYTNWEESNDVTGEIRSVFNISGSSIFSKDTAGSLLDFIFNVSFHPEIAIYKTNLLQKYISWPSNNTYIFFDLMYLFLQEGNIAITAYDFYVEVQVVRPELRRDTRTGSTYYADYSAIQQSLEVFTNRILMDLGHIGLSGEMRNLFFEQLNKFYITRRKLAFTSSTHAHDYVNAIKARHTIALWNGIVNPTEALEFDRIWGMQAAIQCAVSTLLSLSYLEKIVFVGFEDVSIIKELVPNLNSRVHFEFSDINNAVREPNQKALYMLFSKGDFQELVGAGIKAGYIMTLPDMLKANGFIAASGYMEEPRDD